MRRNLSIVVLATLTLVAAAASGFAAGSPGDPPLLPSYFQTTQYYSPPIDVSDPLWSTTMDLTALGDDPADRAYLPDTVLQSAYVTLEHSGSQGLSCAELWLLSVSGEILVGVLGDSSHGWRREHWALSAGARAAIEHSPVNFKVRLLEITPCDDSLQLDMVRVSGSCATPEPSTLALLLVGVGMVVPAVSLRRRARAV